MNTGENEQGLRKILDLTRIISIALLLLHFYYYCYAAFHDWELRTDITDRLLQNIYNTGLFSNFHKSKLIALFVLAISLFGAKGRKDEKLGFKTAMSYIVTGVLLYFLSWLIFNQKFEAKIAAMFYMAITTIGFMLVLTGGTYLSRIISLRMNNSVFNTLNETFPQEERLLNNEYSINLPARYNLKGRFRKSWINIINPFRALLIMG
ncbi:MAG: YWFCY domain-containing protein, partial [Chitinophagaceae bacterium]|nr:YWFCY domain-containing protein [Chitinophagaceae bacterium]